MDRERLKFAACELRSSAHHTPPGFFLKVNWISFKEVRVKKKKLNLPRIPLPRQTEKVVPARRGGTYDRNQFRRETRRDMKEDS